MILPHPRSTLFPYTTLFRSEVGADVAIDYKTQKFEEIAKDVDVVVDGVGGETMVRSYPIVKKGGILVSLVGRERTIVDRKSTRLNSSHVRISYAVFCLKKKK